VLPARRADCDFNVLAEVSQKLHQALDRKRPGAIPHQRGDVRLLDAEDLARLGLGQTARLDELVYLQGQACLN
jgi:hypothetical protein